MHYGLLVITPAVNCLKTDIHCQHLETDLLGLGTLIRYLAPEIPSQSLRRDRTIHHHRYCSVRIADLFLGYFQEGRGLLLFCDS